MACPAAAQRRTHPATGGCLSVTSHPAPPARTKGWLLAGHRPGPRTHVLVVTSTLEVSFPAAVGTRAAHMAVHTTPSGSRVNLWVRLERSAECLIDR
jgi:hypothetical protein